MQEGETHMSNSRPLLFPCIYFIYSLLVERCKIGEEVSKGKEPMHEKEEYPSEKLRHRGITDSENHLDWKGF